MRRSRGLLWPSLAGLASLRACLCLCMYPTDFVCCATRFPEQPRGSGAMCRLLDRCVPANMLLTHPPQAATAWLRGDMTWLRGVGTPEALLPAAAAAAGMPHQSASRIASACVRLHAVSLPSCTRRSLRSHRVGVGDRLPQALRPGQGQGQHHEMVRRFIIVASPKGWRGGWLRRCTY